MQEKNIYVAQIGTDSNINLLPLSAGLLISRLKQEKELLKKFNIGEIIFKREDPKDLSSRIEDVFVMGFSCYLWNTDHSLEVAKEIKNTFPNALIVFGGPSVPQDLESGKKFLTKHPFIDVLCIQEGEEVFTKLCISKSNSGNFEDIPGIIYKEKSTEKICYTGPPEINNMENLPSPFLDGTFSELYKKYSSQFSGIVFETSRGCPNSCAFCTIGIQKEKIRNKSLEVLKKEIDWIGKNKVKYISLSDTNFGINEKDIEFSQLLSECKKEYGVPNYISVSWAKSCVDKKIKISDILRESDIGFRITASLQSLDKKVIKAIKRRNIKSEDYVKIKKAFHKYQIYSYCELILGLPLESYESFIDGVNSSLSESIFEQLYIYPFILLPNTELAKIENINKYKIVTKKIESAYTKRKDLNKIKEYMDIVIETSTMPSKKWVEAFIISNYTLALHDNRLAFFILNHLKRNYQINIVDLITYTRKICYQSNLKVIKGAFLKIEKCVSGVLKMGKNHLVIPRSYGEIPFDPSEGIFLELLLDKEKFYSEFLIAVELYLSSKKTSFNKLELLDLFNFQNAIMAHTNGPKSKYLELKYDWLGYFSYAFHLPEKELKPKQMKLKVVDPHPSNGDPKKFLKNHFDVRGVPAFNLLYDLNGNLVFPPVKLKF